MSNWGRKMSERWRSKERDNSPRKSAPLRKIVEFISVGDGDIFGSGSQALLECGHKVFTHSNDRARCIHCKINSETQTPKP